MPRESGQLVLPFPINEHCVFGNFQIGANHELVARLHDMPGERDFAGLWLWGVAGSFVLTTSTKGPRGEHNGHSGRRSCNERF